jgi:hypothetical protein
MAGKINFAGIISGVESALKAVNELMPIAEAMGAPAMIANISTIAIAAIATAHNTLDRATELKEGISSNDEKRLRELIAQLQGVNDKLAGEIAASDTGDAGGSDSGGDGA